MQALVRPPRVTALLAQLTPPANCECRWQQQLSCGVPPCTSAHVPPCMSGAGSCGAQHAGDACVCECLSTSALHPLQLLSPATTSSHHTAFS